MSILPKATITQLLIPIDDFERGVAFYRDVLGLRLLFAAAPQMAFFQCGAVRSQPLADILKG
jgi:methylmalonyl-CoA/ethylmalonyl-CoA epimerase